MFQLHLHPSRVLRNYGMDNFHLDRIFPSISVLPFSDAVTAWTLGGLRPNLDLGFSEQFTTHLTYAKGRED